MLIHAVKRRLAFYWCYKILENFEESGHQKIWIILGDSPPKCVSLNIFKHIVINEMFYVSIKRSLAFVPKFVQLTMSQYLFRWWLGADQAQTHYLNQCWPSSLTYKCDNKGFKADILQCFITAVRCWSTFRRLCESFRPGNCGDPPRAASDTSVWSQQTIRCVLILGLGWEYSRRIRINCYQQNLC